MRKDEGESEYEDEEMEEDEDEEEAGERDKEKQEVEEEKEEEEADAADAKDEDEKEEQEETLWWWWVVLVPSCRGEMVGGRPRLPLWRNSMLNNIKIIDKYTGTLFKANISFPQYICAIVTFRGTQAFQIPKKVKRTGSPKLNNV